MKSHNFTSALNLKITLVVILLLILTMAYNHFLALQKENEQNLQHMVAITNFILEKKPPTLFCDNGAQSGIPTSDAQLAELHRQLQFVLDDVCIPFQRIKFGFYSAKDGKVVAMGPNFDCTVLSDINRGQMEQISQGAIPNLVYEDASLLWYGTKAMTYTRPIIENNKIVGYAFTSMNQSVVLNELWRKTINTFLGTFVVMIISIIIFRDLFIKLKCELRSFAESMVAGNYDKYRSRFAEFNTILNYISEQTKKMTGLDRLNIVGEMAAGIAHEIRNPMTTVRGLLQFIGNKQEFLKHKENFDLMIDELDRANKIITEFLSLSKNKAFEFKQENLNAIISDILPLLQSNIIYNNSILKLQLEPLPSTCLDKDSIRQLILNMVKNGLDAMPGGGTITLSTKEADGFVILSITDSGTGIPADLKEKLGTPFFTTKENGTGLGLAICYRIVHRHSAVLTCDSRPGQGTTFTIAFHIRSLPAAFAQPEITN